jgi:hypothetical protein
MVTRESLERFVFAWNTPLKESVQSMDLVILLRNAHPIYRAAYAAEFRNAGLLSSELASEFIKIVGK